MRVFWHSLGAGDASTTQTLAEMRRLLTVATRDPYIVQTARNIVARAPSRDPADHAAALYDWLKAHYRFVQDPVDYELVVAPRQLLDDIRQKGFFQEDCESAALLFRVLAESVGIPGRFRVFSRGASPWVGDSRFRHVLTELLISGRWVPYDLTVAAAAPGWRPPVRGPEAVYA